MVSTTMSDDYLSSQIDDYTDEDVSEVFVKRNGILQKISGKEKKKIVANLKKKKGIQKNRELIEDNNDERDNYEVIEDNNDERDNYEVIDHTKLSPEQERNKPEHTWQKPRRD